MRYFIIILILIILIPAFACGADNRDENASFERKNPFLAGILSWYHPGLGQFYVGETGKGTFFWITENVLLFATILNIADIKFSLKRDIGFEFKIRLKSNPSIGRITATAILGVLFIALHIYNVIDAINSARVYNQKLFASEFEVSDSGVRLEGCAFRDVHGIQIVGRF